MKDNLNWSITTVSNVKKAFTSRFKDGALLEVDYSQLEIYVLAYLSGDKQLKADLLSGADLHGISAERLFGKGYSDEQRRIAKQLSFQLQYGAGAKSMAESNGIPVGMARAFITIYYDRYPQVKEWQDSNIYTVKMMAISDPDLRTKHGLPAKRSQLVSETGRIYTFIEKDAPDWMTSRHAGTSPTTFSPTEIKNYPVQGLATGDIMPMIVGKVFRDIKNTSYNDSILLVNTVHDSILFDCKSITEGLTWYYRCKQIMEEAPRYLKEDFNIDFDLPLKVEGKIGKNWFDMEKIS